MSLFTQMLSGTWIVYRFFWINIWVQLLYLHCVFAFLGYFSRSAIAQLSGISVSTFLRIFILFSIKTGPFWRSTFLVAVNQSPFLHASVPELAILLFLMYASHCGIRWYLITISICIFRDYHLSFLCSFFLTSLSNAQEFILTLHSRMTVEGAWGIMRKEGSNRYSQYYGSVPQGLFLT